MWAHSTDWLPSSGLKYIRTLHPSEPNARQINPHSAQWHAWSACTCIHTHRSWWKTSVSSVVCLSVPAMSVLCSVRTKGSEGVLCSADKFADSHCFSFSAVQTQKKLNAVVISGAHCSRCSLKRHAIGCKLMGYVTHTIKQDLAWLNTTLSTSLPHFPSGCTPSKAKPLKPPPFLSCPLLPSLVLCGLSCMLTVLKHDEPLSPMGISPPS